MSNTTHIERGNEKTILVTDRDYEQKVKSVSNTGVRAKKNDGRRSDG